MIAELFVALCRVPSLKKRLWREWYEFLARRYRAADWIFMNYGYAKDDATLLRLDDHDEVDRYCIQLYNHVAGAINLRGLNVLEVGSGRGGGASFVKRYLSPAQMTGIDLSKAAVEFCQRRHPVPGLHFKVGDAEHLPFDDAWFDAVINVESSHCYPSLPGFFSDVHRVLKPNGHFLYADLHDHNTLGEWRQCLKTAGFVIVQESDIVSNVLASLDRDNQRKLTLIDRLVPSILRPSFLNFAAVRGSRMYEAFRSGSLAYRSFVAQREI